MKTKLYAKSYGGRGCTVRVWEPRPNANFMIAPFVNGKYAKSESLGHRDPDKAETAAYDLISALKNGRKQAESHEPSRITIGELVDVYLGGQQHKALGPRQQIEKAALLKKIVKYFGPSKRVMLIDEDAVQGLLTARTKGTHGFMAGKNSAYHCFAHLRSVILWGLKKRTVAGERILREHPFAGLSVTPNKTPKQPIIRHATFEQLRRAGRKLPMYMRVFLIIAEATGRRSGAIRQLEWRDIDLEAGEILWRAESDKMGLEMFRPAQPKVIRYLRVWKKKCPSDRFVFPAPRGDEAVPDTTVDRWPKMFFKAAGLEKPEKTGWHSFRRKWATDRKEESIPDLMAAGGWESYEALMRYLKADEEKIRQIILKPSRRV